MNRTIMLAISAMLTASLPLEAPATSYISRDYYSVGEECLYQIKDRSISGEVTLGAQGLIGGDNCEGKPSGLPYVVESDIVIEPTGVLRIEPGVTIMFKDGPTDFKVLGTLIADGVLFTTNSVPPFPRDWSGIRFSGPGAAHSQLENCVFEYGGASLNNVLGLVQCEDGADIIIESCVFSHSGLYGVLTDGASPTITDCMFTECQRFPVYQRSLDSFPDYSGNVFMDNAYRGVLLASGTIECSGIWQNPGIPYVVSTFGGLGVLEIARNATLMVEPGTTVKFINPEGRLDVYGVLDAEGTPQQLVNFTSYANDLAGGDSNGDGDETSPAPGDFSGIRFLSSDSAASFLSCCAVSFGGQGREGTASVYLSMDANVVFNTCLFAHSLDIGLSAVSAYPDLLGCFFIGNRTAVLCKGSAQPMIDHCNFFGNSQYAVRNESVGAVVPARECFWGHETGPSDTSDDTSTGGLYNPHGQGNRVSDGVDYSDFLQELFWGPTFSIRPNEAAFAISDDFRLYGAYTNLVGELWLDVYVAITFPEGELIFYPTFSTFPEPVPVALPALSALPEFELLALRIPSAVPRGDYFVLAAGFWPGTFDFVTNLATSRFSVY
ncbi:MAG: right-handed parallel beta-helix repeat-containing protein [Candidatus Coatesbacteria bacterium]|nr:right-handed parallel beta-helix repeat-containing protein [Candidatus Coatesbacteria bacterium]